MEILGEERGNLPRHLRAVNVLYGWAMYRQFAVLGCGPGRGLLLEIRREKRRSGSRRRHRPSRRSRFRARRAARPDRPVRLHLRSSRRHLAHGRGGRSGAFAGPVLVVDAGSTLLLEVAGAAAPRRPGGAQGRPDRRHLQARSARRRARPRADGPREGPDELRMPRVVAERDRHRPRRRASSTRSAARRSARSA